MTVYKVKKVYSNNIVKAKDSDNQEIILLGKGIGYRRGSNDIIPPALIEKGFLIKDTKEQHLYEQLLMSTSPKLIEISYDIITFIQSEVQTELSEHIHVALTDHIAFLVRRYKTNSSIINPFSLEIEQLYPKEAKIAQQVVSMLNERLHIALPQSEVSFIVLHIVSSITNESMENIQMTSRLIKKITGIIEEQIHHEIDKKSLSYSRLVTHIRFMIERTHRKEKISIPEELAGIIKENYGECYSIAYKAGKIVQNKLQTQIDFSEIILLSLHIYRFTDSSESEGR